MMTEESSSKSASVAIESFSELVKAIGPVFVDRSMDSVKDAIIRLLEKQHVLEEDEDL